MKRAMMLAALIGMLLAAASRAEDPAPLVLEAKVPLGAVAGRIDHFAFDPAIGNFCSWPNSAMTAWASSTSRSARSFIGFPR
jgi:hypothetical protein